MYKKAIEKQIRQIIAAANSVEIPVTLQNQAQAQQNMAQLMGICRSAREVWRLVNLPVEKVKESEADGG